MGRRSHGCASRLALGTVVLLTCAVPALDAGAAPVDAGEVILADLGSGWTIVDEQAGTLGSYTRTWRGAVGELSIHGFPVTEPPGVEVLFRALTDLDAGVAVLAEPRLDLAAWLVPAGDDPGDFGFTGLAVASSTHLFMISLAAATGADVDGPDLVLDLARRQIDAAGGPPVATAAAPTREVDDAELLPLLPDEPPPGYGLPVAGMTLSGADQLELTAEVVDEVADFLNRRTKNVVRVWGREGLTVGIGLNRYPYDIFAAAALGEYDVEGSFPIDAERRRLLRDAVTFRQPDDGTVGVVFRRGDRMVLVLAEAAPPDTDATAIAVALDAASEVAGRLPDGSSEPYQFPAPPSRIVGLVLTALIVVGAVAGSRGVASLRARRVRRRWAALEPPVPLPPPGSPAVEVVELDEDATALRRRGRLVAAVQLLTVIVGVVALAGDFATPGIVVAAASLAIGLAFSRWWVRREIGLFGPTAPSRSFTRPRPLGTAVALATFAVLVVGVVALAGDFATPGIVVAAASLAIGLAFSRWWVRREIGLFGPTAPSRSFTRPRPLGTAVALATFAVLGIGVAYFLKGVRYLIFAPTLAQLRWSDLLGLSPRAVGVAFALGGLAVTFVGGGLYRLARALSRSGAQRVLAEDPRPPALYLRSFADDSLPLPTIASARRPLFELFSLRGADPFEESVAWELNSYAPVVAVGRPGGTLRSLGAAREHLEQDSWRGEIAERMRESRVIVLAPGETAGLAWELGAIVQGAHLDKTLFVFPPLSPVHLARRWHHTVGLLRDAGAPVGTLTVPFGGVHTVRVATDGALSVTVARTRDEATYRTAVDRAIDPAPAAPPTPAVPIPIPEVVT